MVLLAAIAHGMAGVDSLLETKNDCQVWSLASTCICLVPHLSSILLIFALCTKQGPLGDIAVTRTRGIARVDTL